MSVNTTNIISRIGETDQLYLTNNSPELALERGDLRLELATISHSKQEQIHFLQEAIVLLETARVEYEEIPMALYVKLSLHLAKAYMVFFEITKETRYALIKQKFLRPLTINENADVYFFLAYAAVSKNEMAMTRHWIGKYLKTPAHDLTLLQSHSAFHPVRNAEWFPKALQVNLRENL